MEYALCMSENRNHRLMPANRNTRSATEDDEDRSGLLKLAAAGLAVGALAGLVGCAFHVAVDYAVALRSAVVAWALQAPWLGWLAPVALTAAAAFIARWLVRRFAPEASGSGVQHVEAVVQGEARPVRAIVLPVKFIGGTLALGSGLALGREGPTVQMGATLGRLFARHFGLSAADDRALLAAGAGAGLAAAFNAPLAGALFVFEELVRRFELRVAVAALTACSAALAVMRALIGNRLEFSVPAFEMQLFPGYLLFLVFGGLLGLLGVAYNRMVVAGLDVAERMRRVAPEVRAALVGAIFGLLACVTPALVGGGETLIQSVLDGGQSVAMLLIIFAARLVLGPLSYAPGLPGGLFAPLLVVGAAAGALFGHALETALPVLTAPKAAYAAVGMGALFVGVVRAPVTGIALIVEMTGATALFIPLLTACAAAVAVPTALGDPAIYDALRLRDATRQREHEP
jgi:CIC family chloride channel protein